MEERSMRDEKQSPVTRRRTAAPFLALGLLVAAPLLRADDKPAAEEPAFKVNAFASVWYSYNTNEPPSGLNQYRVFDYDDAAIKLEVGELVFQRTTPNAGNVGFRMDLTAGQTLPRVAAASGLFRDPDTGEAENFDLQQAYVTWNAPVGRGLRVDFGKYVTHLGYEVIQGYDGWNDNFSRSLLFGYTIPFTHTGLKMTYAGEKASVTAMVVQGWDNVEDNNGGKSIGAQVLLTPSQTVSFYLNWMGGPERADSSDRRDVFNPILVLKPGRFVLAADYVYGHEKNTFGPALDATWQGLAGYVRLNPSSRVGLTVRGEWMDDEDGARTGVAQTLKEVTFTPEVRVWRGFYLRGEVRHDLSDQSVFEDESGMKKSQTTFALNAFYTF
jgi:hypothetical protein